MYKAPIKKFGISPEHVRDDKTETKKKPRIFSSSRNTKHPTGEIKCLRDSPKTLHPRAHQLERATPILANVIAFAKASLDLDTFLSTFSRESGFSRLNVDII